MEIKSIKRPWIKNKQVIKPDTFYQSPQWKATVDRIWIRDNNRCQLCKEKGITHILQRGTKDLSMQGTVDHKVQRIKGGSDSDNNLWLIGSNHHNSKRANESNKSKTE